MTKAEEIKLLAEIDRLIKSAGDDSYIHDTFAGIVAVCYGNIVDDFGNHPVEDLEEMRIRVGVVERDRDEKNRLLAESQKMLKKALDDNEQNGKTLLKLEHENQALQTHLDEATEELTMWKNRYSDMCGIADNNAESADEWEKNAHEAGDLYCELEKECAKKDMEIVRLKAEIYDLRKECGK